MSEFLIDELRAAATRTNAGESARLIRLEELWRAEAAGSPDDIQAETPATLADLWNCYRLLLNRAPDPIGAPYYLDRVRGGMSVHELVRYFIFSTEHQAKYNPPKQLGPVRMNINGLDLYLPIPRTGADLLVRATGQHKPHLAGAIASIVRPGMCVLDIGAGAGEFAIHAGRKVGASGRVVALEPHAEAFRSLLANVAAYGLENVDCLPFAAGDCDGFVALVTSDGIASARDVAHEDLTSNTVSPVVYARTCDSIIPVDQRIDIVAIGLDGFDHRALTGATSTLARWRPHLFGDYAPALLETYSGVKPQTYLRLLQDLGYRRFTAIATDKGALDLGNDVDALASMPGELGVDRIDFYASPT